MTTEIIIAATPTSEYIKRYAHSENWQTIQALASVLNDNQKHISLNIEEIHDSIECNTEDNIAFFLILDPLGIGTDFSIEQIQNIINELRTLNIKNSFFIAITNAFTTIDAKTQEIIRLADNLVFLKESDYSATKNILKAEQKFLIIDIPNNLESNDTFIDDRDNNILVNGDVLYTVPVRNLCILASKLQNEQSTQVLKCYIEVPFKHDSSALAWLLKAVHPRISAALDKKLTLDPSLSARELVAWFEEQDDALIGPEALPIELTFNKQHMVNSAIDQCTYAYDPIHAMPPVNSCRVNGLIAARLLILMGDPTAVSNIILDFENDNASLKEALQKQTQAYEEKFSNTKICEALLKYIDSIVENETTELRTQYPNVNPDYWYDEDFLWPVVLSKFASLNLHLADEENGGIVLKQDNQPFINNDSRFTVTNAVQIGGQEVAINLRRDQFKKALKNGLSEDHVIITPIFKKDIVHWCVAFLEVLGNEANLTILETLQNDIGVDFFEEVVQSALPNITINNRTTVLFKPQSDSASCGPLAIKHLFGLLTQDTMKASDSEYTTSEIFALRQEQLELLDAPELIERQKKNIPAAKEPEKPRINFDLVAAMRCWREFGVKHRDRTPELSRLCHQFLMSELSNADNSNAKSEIKTWFASNAEPLGFLPLFNIFFEYPKSSTDNNEPRWKDGGVDNLVAFLKIASNISIQNERRAKILRFSTDDPERSSEATDYKSSQRPRSRQESTSYSL